MRFSVQIAAIGEAMIELIIGKNDTAQIGVAGDSFNTAVYLARSLVGTDVEVAFVTALGTDRYSDLIFERIKAYGLAVSHIERRGDKMPGLYAIDTDENGERSFSYWRSDSAARTLFSKPCRIDFNALSDFDLVYLSGITLAILPAQTRAELFDWADDYRAAGGKIAYDSNYRPALWENRKTAQTANKKMWSRCDIALPSLDDEMALYGDKTEAEAVKRLLSYGIKSGALKRGDQGPLDLDNDQTKGVFPKAQKVIDTTAAGDSFNAGYLAARITGSSQAEALESGHALASKVIAHKGAIIPL